MHPCPWSTGGCDSRIRWRSFWQTNSGTASTSWFHSKDNWGSCSCCSRHLRYLSSISLRNLSWYHYRTSSRDISISSVYCSKKLSGWCNYFFPTYFFLDFSFLYLQQLVYQQEIPWVLHSGMVLTSCLHVWV